MPLPSKRAAGGGNAKASHIVCGFTSTFNHFLMQVPKQGNLGLNVTHDSKQRQQAEAERGLGVKYNV